MEIFNCKKSPRGTTWNYQWNSNLQLSSVDDLKKHWHFKLCNKLNKPTSQMGENEDRILRCIRINNRITGKSDSILLGIDKSSRR